MNKRTLKRLEPESWPNVIESAQIAAMERLSYIFTAKAQAIGGERVLTATFFSLKENVAEFRVFFNRQNFITERLTPERKWSQATLDGLISYRHGDNAADCADEESARCVRAFFHAGEEARPYQILLNFQRKLRQNQLSARHKRETDGIDRRMREIKKLPADFEYWLKETVFDFSRYIYYKRQSKRLILGFCTSCGGEAQFEITAQNLQKLVCHNKAGQCPLCGKNVVFKAIGRTTGLIDCANAALMQKTATGFAIRYFAVRKEYEDHYRQPKLEVRELMRDFYDGRDIDSYEFGRFKQTNQVRWRHSLRKFNLDTACLYHRNVKRILADTELKYCGLAELAKNLDRFNIYRYLNAYISYPAYEYLVKQGLYRFAADNIDSGGNLAQLNFAGRNIREVMAIGPIQARQLRRIGGGVEHYRLIKAAFGARATLTDSQLQSFIEMKIDGRRLGELLRFTTPGKIIRYLKCCAKISAIGETAHSFQSAEADIAAFWSDYLTNCALLSYDMRNNFILFPHDLKVRHDEAAALVKTNKAELLNHAIATLNEPLQNRYGFARKGLLIRSPLSADEIVAEGHALRHCVGTGAYIEEMAKNQYFILFVRQTERPDEPFFTLEIKDNALIQCRGQNNCAMTEEVAKFLAEFRKKKLIVDN